MYLRNRWSHEDPVHFLKFKLFPDNRARLFIRHFHRTCSKVDALTRIVFGQFCLTYSEILFVCFKAQSYDPFCTLNWKSILDSFFLFLKNFSPNDIWDNKKGKNSIFLPSQIPECPTQLFANSTQKQLLLYTTFKLWNSQHVTFGSKRSGGIKKKSLKSHER